MTMKILHRNDLPLGGFAGLKEHRLIVDKKMGPSNPDAWNGIGNFVYLADASFLPHGETGLHGHREIDVISVMVDGNIAHEGSLEHGKAMMANQAQVQRAGGEGFEHNEINPDASRNRMIQLWALPENPGEPAGYKFYDLEQGKVTRIYGGGKNQNDTFDSHTVMEVGRLDAGQELTKKGEFIAYVTKGGGQANGEAVQNGDLLRGEDLNFTASDSTQIIIVSTE